MTSDLTTRERLLVAQGVHELGAGDWDKVSALLDPHPLCSTRPEGFWSPERCRQVYDELIAENKIKVPAETAAKPKAKEHLKLARIYYFARVAELRAAIFSGIEDFKRIANEIKDIKAGKWDDKLPPAKASSTGHHTRDSTREDAEIAAELVPPTTADDKPDAGTSAAMDADPVEGTPAPTEDAETGAEGEQDGKARKTKRVTPAGRRKGRRARGETDELTSPKDELRVKSEEEEPVAGSSLRVNVPPFGEVAATDAALRESAEPSELGADDEGTPATARRGGRRSNPKSRKRKRTESVEPGSAARPSASPDVDLKRQRIDESAAEDDQDRASSHESELTQAAEEKRARDLRFRKSMQLVHDQIISDGRSTFFRSPVRRADAPAYYDAIKRPMDFKTVGTRLRTGIITSTAAYRRDVMTIFANAVMFNNPTTGHELVKQAVEMAQVAEDAIAAYEAIESRQAE